MHKNHNILYYDFFILNEMAFLLVHFCRFGCALLLYSCCFFYVIVCSYDKYIFEAREKKEEIKAYVKSNAMLLTGACRILWKMWKEKTTTKTKSSKTNIN